MRFIYAIILVLFINIDFGCGGDILKEKTFKREIRNGKVVKKIDIKRGDFLLVYIHDGMIDTLPVYRYNNFFDQIDTFTILNKPSNSFLLKLENLKNKHGNRYNSTITLIYW